MDAGHTARQRIERLTPLAVVLARIDSLVAPLPPIEVPLARAAGRVLAADIATDATRPAHALAWRDGWAVRSDETLDAGSYAPAVLSATGAVEVGEALPGGADAVAPFDAVRFRGGAAEALAPVAPGDGVLLAGTDTSGGDVLRPAGDLVRSTEMAALQALGVTHAMIREPRILVARARPGRDDVIDAIVTWLVGTIAAGGGAAIVSEPSADAVALEDALRSREADAIVVIGGTGMGSRDHSVQVLARAGRVEVHGIGLIPGETTAFGVSDGSPVLLVPGRLDAALAAWLTLGQRMLARLSGRRDDEPAVVATLLRKVASTVGLVEIVPVRRTGETVEPLASGHLPLSALTQADGWIMVPADSEGFPAGARVAVRPLP